MTRQHRVGVSASDVCNGNLGSDHEVCLSAVKMQCLLNSQPFQAGKKVTMEYETDEIHSMIEGGKSQCLKYL